MMNVRKWRKARLVIPGLLVWVLWLGLGGTGVAAEGDPLPAMALPDVSSGTVLDVPEYLKGAVGAITYMQTSCAACRKELIALKDLAAQYPQFKVVSISVDAGNPARVKRYRDHFGFDFPFLHDPEFTTPELFEFSFTPALVLVDKQGNIALLKGGFRPGDEVQLKEKVAALSARQ